MSTCPEIPGPSLYILGQRRRKSHLWSLQRYLPHSMEHILIFHSLLTNKNSSSQTSKVIFSKEGLKVLMTQVGTKDPDS